MGRIALGDRVRDRISGFQGIATGTTHYLNGCHRVQVEYEGLHDGKLLAAEWFDEVQLDVVLGRGTETAALDVTGGPSRATAPARDPSPRRPG